MFFNLLTKVKTREIENTSFGSQRVYLHFLCITINYVSRILVHREMLRTVACQDMMLLSMDDGRTLSRASSQALLREKHQSQILRMRSSSSAHSTTAEGIGASVVPGVTQARTRWSDSTYAMNVAGQSAASTRVTTSVAVVAQILPNVNANGTEAERNEHGHTLASNIAISAIMRDTTLNAVEKQLRAQAVRANHCQQPGTTTAWESKSSSNSSFEINRSMHAKLAALAQAHEAWLPTQPPLPVDSHGLPTWPPPNALAKTTRKTRNLLVYRAGKLQRAKSTSTSDGEDSQDPDHFGCIADRLSQER